jgi:predicted alpha/beta hydrolase family esterase
MSAPVLVLPGLGNSGPEHWQSHWERRDAACRRVHQDEWDSPSCTDWVNRLADELAAQRAPVVLAAHSAACALVAHWAAGAGAAAASQVRGALLVAPSNPLGPIYPKEPTGFAPVPLLRLPFRAIVVSSTDDPYVELDVARQYSSAWGASIEVLVGAGHINAVAGFGPWPEGWELLSQLRQA